MKKLVAVAVLTASVLGGVALATTASEHPWPHMYVAALGQPLHRATVVATAATPKDNTNTSAGGSVTYTFTGGEHICLQGNAAFYFEVIASASMTASGGKAVYVDAVPAERCFFLKPGATKVSIDAVTGTVTVKMFETDWP